MLTLISAVPRSRSAWVASWLARSGVRVLHDPSRGCGSFRDYAQRLVGPRDPKGFLLSHHTIAVDTGLPVLWPRLLEELASEFPSVAVRLATLYRNPTSDSVASLVAMPLYRDQHKRWTHTEASETVRMTLLGNELLRNRIASETARVVPNYNSSRLVIDPHAARALWEWATGLPWDPEAWEQARCFRVTIDSENLNCYPERARGLAAEVRPFWDKVMTGKET